ncbi:MAG: hypothetical protein J5636_11400 [Clostridiales bacterium]|nr:hypothetical protein [Clostridiales bacterium]
MLTRRHATIAVLCLLAVVFVFVVFLRLFDPWVDKEENMERGFEKMDEYTAEFNDRKFDVMFYRVDPETVAPRNLVARRIDNMEDAKVSGSGFAGRMIVLCDQGSGQFIEPEEFTVLKELLEMNNVYFVYIGELKYGMLKDAGIIDNIPKEGTMSYLVYHSMTKRGGAANIADENLLIPVSIRHQITPEQLAVYSFITEMAERELYWN